MQILRDRATIFLRWTEQFTKTDMVYLVSNSFWVNLNFLFVTIFSFLLSVAFANLLPKTEYGIYQYILAIAAFLTAFTFTGMNSAITQSVAQGREDILRSSICIQLAWNVIPAAAAFAAALYYFYQGNSVLGFGLICVSLSLPLINSFNSYSAFLNGRKDFRSAALYAMGGNTIYYVCIFLGIFLFPSAAALVCINLAVTTGAAVTLYLYTVRTHQPNTVKDPSAIPYARHLTGMNVLSVIAAHLDKILVFQFIGAAGLAAYALAVLLPERLAGSFKSLLYIAFPRFSDRNMSDIRAGIYWKSFLVLIVTLGSALAYSLIAPFLLRILYPEYLNIIPYSQVYALTFVATIGHLVTIILIAHKRLRELYVLNTIVPVLQIGALIIGIAFWGLWGLIIARVASSVVFSVIAVFLLMFLREGSTEA